MRKPILRLGATLLLSFAALQSSHAFNVIEGQVIEFTGPDQLLLDPANVVAAVKFQGPRDFVVEGVTFYTDRPGLGAGSTLEKEVSVGGVTTTIIAASVVSPWAAAPAFTGGTAPSATELGEVMRDIRFSGAPGNVEIDVAGLNATTTYDVQLLYNEGQNNGNRRWDIGVEGNLVVDDMSSHGGVFGSYTPNNSFAYRGQFLPGGDGVLSIVQGQNPLPGDPNNTPFVPVDNNSIVQAIIVTEIPPTAPSEVALSNDVFAAASPIGASIGTLSSTDVNLADTHSYTLVAGAGDTDNASFQIIGNEVQNAVDLTAGGVATYSIRVQSLDTGGQTFEKAFVLTATADTDADGLPDNWETDNAGNLTDLTGLLNGPGPGPNTGDFDGDGCTDLVEFTIGTNPTNTDSDSDGSNDGDEKANSTDPLNPDTDGDGLNDGDEASNSTNPLNPDSDGDNVSDGDEVTNGTNPNNVDTDGDGRNDDLDGSPLDPGSASRTVVLAGEVIEFSGPDDLNIHPPSHVIAVDLLGDFNKVINGVTFQTDGTTAGAPNVVTNGGVSVTTAAPNAAGNWAVQQVYTAADQGSANALEEVMRDIRWALASQEITIDIAGLDPAQSYEISYLVNEGANRNRYFDIEVEGNLVVDNLSSEGLEFDNVYSGTNGFAYVGEFVPSGDGILNIRAKGDLGGNAPIPTDNNPIIQGLIVNQGGRAPTGLDLAANPAGFAPALPIGGAVGTFSSVDINKGDTHSYALVAGSGDTDNGLFQIVGDELQGNADFSALQGQTLSIRVQTTDSKGLTFEGELQVLVADDIDGDNIPDVWELSFVATLPELNGLLSGPGPGPGSGDFDGDGSGDLDEFNNGTDPTDPDSDGDGSNDGDEATNGTDPNNPDTDGDGLDDGDEATETTNPLVADTDGDGLSDGDEVLGTTRGEPTSPILADSDGDGRNDDGDPEPNNSAVNSLTKVLVGDIIEFNGPDDLHLDPATAVIAVDLFGAADKDVNGVNFQADGQVLGFGSVTNGSVTVSSTAPNGIGNWANPGGGGTTPGFTGGTAGSAANLAVVMESIRWNGAPNPVLVDIEGLTPGAVYELQLLTNEGRNRGAVRRIHDIEVEGTLVVDNHTSSGREGVQFWDLDNSFAYVGEFTAPADGILNVVMQADLGGDPTFQTIDNNPILQGVVLHLATPALPPVLDVDRDPSGDLVLSWDSAAGKVYDILSSIDPEADGDPETWAPFDPGTGLLTELPATPPLNIETFALPGDLERFFVVVEKPAPPLFEDDFETDEGWLTGSNNANPGTAWERGAPLNVGPLSGADASVNCFGTNIADEYFFDADIWLRSPPIDLTNPGITGARLSFQHYRDMESPSLPFLFDFGSVRVLDATPPNTQLGADIVSDLTGFDTLDWESFSAALPPEAVGQNVILEFQFVSDDQNNFAGWYIDNVEVTLE